MQTAVMLALVTWAAWTTFGNLLPLRQRRLRGWLARRAEGHLPAALVQRIRPGFPATGCGCGSACTPTRTDP